MADKDIVPEKVQAPHFSNNDVILVSWVARRGQANVSSLPQTDIKAVWRNEIGDAQVTQDMRCIL